MKKVTRREALKFTGKAAIGATFAVGVGSLINEKVNQDKPTISDAKYKQYDTGTVSINASGWTKSKGLAENYAALEQDLTTDVLVIGAGLAGSSLALHLSEQGVDTVVLEARQPGWGRQVEMRVMYCRC